MGLGAGLDGPGKYCPHRDSNHRIVLPVASRYTAYAMPVAEKYICNTYYILILLLVVESLDNVVGIVARVRHGPSVVRISAVATDFLFSKTVRTGSGAHPASYSMGTGVLYWG